jgi:hypothetical protein
MSSNKTMWSSSTLAAKAMVPEPKVNAARQASEMSAATMPANVMLTEASPSYVIAVGRTAADSAVKKGAVIGGPPAVGT